MDSLETGRLIYLALLGGAIIGYAIVSGRYRLGEFFRHAAMWALIFVGTIAAFGLWNDIRRDVAPRQSVMETGQIEVPRRADGHYYLTLEVNGTPVEFVVDTGATGVVLSHDDAQAAGIDLDSLRYLGTANTANGAVRTARVVLDEVALGPITDSRVGAFVTDGDLSGSLLGMSYLQRFAKIEIEGNRLILTR